MAGFSHVEWSNEDKYAHLTRRQRNILGLKMLLKYLGIACVVFLAYIIIILGVSQYHMSQIKAALTSLALPPQTQILETRTGHWDYLSADKVNQLNFLRAHWMKADGSLEWAGMLIQTDLPEKDIREYYSQEGCLKLSGEEETVFLFPNVKEYQENAMDGSGKTSYYVILQNWSGHANEVFAPLLESPSLLIKIQVSMQKRLLQQKNLACLDK